MKSTQLLCVGLLGSLSIALWGCPDDPVILPGGTGGDGGQADGGGGTGTLASTTTNMMGGGGAGGDAGMGGDGGDGGSPPNLCEDGCAKIDTCTGIDRCSDLSVDCSMNPSLPQANIACVIDCAGEAASSCAEIAAYLDGNDATVPGPDSNLTRCIATCDLPAAQTGILDCMAQGDGTGGAGGAAPTPLCIENIQCDANDTDCMNWFNCARNCPDPACYTTCNNTYTGAADNYDPYYNCLCNDLPTDHSALLLLGQAYCTDIAIGLTDPCNQ